MSKLSRSGSVKSAKARSGGVRTGPYPGGGPCSTFAAMASLAEEVEEVSVVVGPATVEPATVGPATVGPATGIFELLREGTRSWGELDALLNPPAIRSLPQDLRGEAELWALFGPRGLTEHNEDVYNVGVLSDEDYCAFMRWLYWHGWDVVMECRDAVEAYPAFFMCRQWIPEEEDVYEEVSAERAAELEADREDMLRERERSERRYKLKEAKAAGIAVRSSLFPPSSGCGGGWSSTPAPRQVTLAGTAATKPKAAPVPAEPLSAPGSDVGKRNGCPVARFCKEGTACPTAGCRYVHGNTIPRINEDCKFGAGCGSGDAAKRATCLRMHPGETWTAELVIKRV